ATIHSFVADLLVDNFLVHKFLFAHIDHLMGGRWRSDLGNFLRNQNHFGLFASWLKEIRKNNNDADKTEISHGRPACDGLDECRVVFDIGQAWDHRIFGLSTAQKTKSGQLNAGHRNFAHIQLRDNLKWNVAVEKFLNVGVQLQAPGVAPKDYDHLIIVPVD